MFDKELEMVRQQEYFDLYEQEYNKLLKDRDAVLAKKLEEEVKVAADELAELQKTMAADEKKKKDWEDEDAKLRKAKKDLEDAGAE